jgi:hypothetical protein
MPSDSPLVLHSPLVLALVDRAEAEVPALVDYSHRQEHPQGGFRKVECRVAIRWDGRAVVGSG